MRCILFPALALAWSLAYGAGPTGYVLSTVAKTGDTISGKKLTGFNLPSLGASAPAINAGGMVAFYATYSEEAYVGEGIFTPTSLVLKTGDVVSGQVLDGIGFVPALNDSGAIVVRGLFSSGSTAILTSTTVFAQTGDTIGGQRLISIGPTAMNSRGALAFVGEFSGGTGIFSQTELLAKSGGVIAGQRIATFGPPAIN